MDSYLSTLILPMIIFASSVRARCKEWFGYTIPTFKPLYFYIPLVSPLKKSDKVDGFNMGEDNQIKSIDIKNGKLRLEVSILLWYLAYVSSNAHNDNYFV